MTTTIATRFPAIAFVLTRFVDNYVTVGTATLIGPRLLLTAGHVVYDRVRIVKNKLFLAKSGLPSSLTVTMGPKGSRFTVKASAWRADKTWVKRDSHAPVGVRIRSSFDLGAIILPKPVDFKVGGVFVPQTTESEMLTNLPLDVAGFSADAYFKMANRRPLSHLLASGTNNHRLLDGFAHRLVYPVDTVAGMSGGPVWSYQAASGNRTIHGIHTSKIASIGGSALRITDHAMSLINQWQMDSRPITEETA